MPETHEGGVNRQECERLTTSIAGLSQKGEVNGDHSERPGMRKHLSSQPDLFSVVRLRKVIRQYRKPLEALGLTYTQYIVMMVLWEHGDMTESTLGHIVRLDSGTLTPLLKRLEKQGLIVRTHPESGERKLFLSLTEAGRALRERALDVPGQMNGCIDLPTEELLQLKYLLDKALTGMGRTRT